MPVRVFMLDSKCRVRRRKMASFRGATHHFGRSWGEPFTIRVSSTFHRTAFGTVIAWLDELGMPITVQQRAVRHGNIRVMMNYDDAIGEGLREASAKVAAKAIPQ